VESRGPITKKECLEIFLGPNRKYRSLLEAVINKKAKINTLAAVKKA